VVRRVDVWNIVVSTVAGGLAGLGTSRANQYWSIGTSRRIRRDVEREEALKDLVERCAVVERCVDDILAKPELNPNDVHASLNTYVLQLAEVWRARAAPFIPKTEVLLINVSESLRVARRSLAVADLRTVQEKAGVLRTNVQGELE
jgi:hypothetical protein